MQKKLVLKQNIKLNKEAIENIEEKIIEKLNPSQMSSIDIANLAIEKLIEKLGNGYNDIDTLSEMREWVKIREEAFKENSRLFAANKNIFAAKNGYTTTGQITSGSISITSPSPNPYNTSTEPYKIVYYNSNTLYGT